jgi:hypothetical protein
MKCNQCQGKLYRIDKRFAGWVLVFLAVIMGLPIHPALSLKFGIATYIWGVLFLVPAISLLRSKPTNDDPPTGEQHINQSGLSEISGRPPSLNATGNAGAAAAVRTGTGIVWMIR